MRRLLFPRFGHGARIVWLRNYLSWVKSYRSSVLMNFGEPLTNLLALGFGLGAYVAKMQGVPFIDFIAPGLLAVTAMNAVTFDMAFEGYDRVHDSGIYKALIASPLDVQELVGGEFLWEATRSLLYGAIFFVVILAFGFVHSAWAILLPIPLLLAGMLFAAPALWVASVASNHEQLFYYFSLFVTPMFLFAGVFFPITGLPWELRTLIWLTPLFHVVDLMRGLILGQLSPKMLVDLAFMIGYTLLFGLMPCGALRRRLSA